MAFVEKIFSHLKEIEKEVSALDKSQIGILDQYNVEFPSHQNAISIFLGEWSSKIPGFEGAGGASLFDDARIHMMEKAIGGFKDKTVLELGPLEGGHTHMMLEKGAKHVTGIEANSRAFLKCLIVKEILGMEKASFYLGDFNKFVETHDRYDFILASGVLYHCLDPVKTLFDLAESSDQIGIWTHYYDAVICQRIYGERFKDKSVKAEYKNFKSQYYKMFYKESLNWSGFCGGSNPETNWMPREDWLRLFDHLGFEYEILSESNNHPNGPQFTIVAQRKKTRTATQK